LTQRILKNNIKKGEKMPLICPVTDLETKLSEITKIIHETDEPIFLTNNGYGDMVMMNIKIWEELNYENEIYQRLIEAQAEAQSNPLRLSHNEIFDPLRQKINKYIKAAEND